MPATFALMLLATLAIAGVPPFAGFFSKDEILAAAFARATTSRCTLFYAMGVGAALLTAFYMARLITMTFLGEYRTGEKAAWPSARSAPGHDRPTAGAWRPECAGGLINLPAFCWRGVAGALAGAGHRACGEVLRLADADGRTELFLVGGAVPVGILGSVCGVPGTQTADASRRQRRRTTPGWLECSTASITWTNL